MKYLRALSALTLAAGLAILALSGAGGVQDVFAAQEQSGVLAQALADGALIRLHIVADDDSDEAQRVKLCVRDVLLDRFSAELSALDAPEAALEWLNAHLSEIEQAADAELRAQGAAYYTYIYSRSRIRRTGCAGGSVYGAAPGAGTGAGTQLVVRHIPDGVRAGRRI